MSELYDEDDSGLPDAMSTPLGKQVERAIELIQANQRSDALNKLQFILQKATTPIYAEQLRELIRVLRAFFNGPKNDEAFSALIIELPISMAFAPVRREPGIRQEPYTPEKQEPKQGNEESDGTSEEDPS